MGLFDRDIVKDSVSEIYLCRDFLEYFIKKYIRIKVKGECGDQLKINDSFVKYIHEYI